MRRDASTVPCPHCGEHIKKDARACPHCGSDEQTGWSDRTYLDGVELGDDVDYNELVQNEFPSHSPAPKKIPWIAVAGVTVLFFFIAAMLKMLW